MSFSSCRYFSTLQQAVASLPQCVSDSPWRVLCEEVAAINGQRQFLTCHHSDIVGVWATRPGKHCCLYEVIPSNTPCHLFLDLEFDKFLNASVDGDAAVDIVIDKVNSLVDHLLPQAAAALNRHLWWTELDATSTAKFSRHLILHIPG